MHDNIDSRLKHEHNCYLELNAFFFTQYHSTVKLNNHYLVNYFIILAILQ